MRKKSLYTFLLVAMLSSCLNPEGVMSDPAGKDPDAGRVYHLDAAARARIGPGFDADALEAFLQLHPPEQRESLLRTFQTPQISTENHAHDVSYLTHVSDPQLQEALEKVWAPKWVRYSIGELERIDPRTPGVKLALERARKQPQGKSQ